MLEELLNEIDRAQESIEFSKKFLKELRSYRRRLLKSLSTSKKTYDSLSNKNVFVEKVSKSILESVKEEAPNIIKEELFVAVSKNREYAHTLFLDALLNVIETPGLITISTVGVGFSTRLVVDIEFLGYAGSLNDWAKGVIETRREFGISKGSDAERASKVWREKIYLRGPYDKTIRNRIEKSGRPAAFWLLLDKGTVSLSSDRGGTAYPSYHRPTNFVDYSITKIKRLFNQELNQEKEKYRENIAILKEEILLAESYLRKLDDLVNEISIELAKNRIVYSKFSSAKDYIDKNKLDDVLIRLRNNLDLSITSEGRIELTKKGSAKRVRPYISRLRNIIGE